MTLLEEFAHLFQSLGLGTYKPDAVDGTIYFPSAPDSPDVCITLALYSGGESSSRDPYDEPRLQARFRGTSTDGRIAEANAQAAYLALHGLGHRALAGGTELQLAVGIGSGPEYMGRDQNARHEYVVNFRTEVYRPTVVRPA